MSDLNENILEKWERVKTLVEMAEHDVLKNARGNHQAGIRARKVLRQLKEEAHALIKITVEESKKAAE